MELRAGTKLYSAVSGAQFIVVRAPDRAVEVACGGAPVLDAAPGSDPDDQSGASPDDAVQVGKRYVDGESNLELLCTRGGGGSLTVEGRPVDLKGAKPLPASD